MAYRINDDNCMPYQSLLAKHGKTNDSGVSQFSLNQLNAFVVPIYEKIYMQAEYIEKLVLHYLKRNSTFAPIRNGLNLNNLVIRILLTSSKSYKLFRGQHPIPNDLDNIYRQISMPKFVWLVELSTRELFKRRQVIGEIIFDATASNLDRLAFITIHFPKKLFYQNRELPSIKKGQEFELVYDCPYTMYQSNLKEC